MTKKIFTFCFLSMVAITAICPKSYLAWGFESLNAIGAFILLFYTWERFTFRGITLVLILVQLGLMLIGAHYVFNEVPGFRFAFLGMPERGWFDWLTHFTVAFPITFAALDLLSRKFNIKHRGMLMYCAISFGLALAACWEMIEALAAVITNDRFDFEQGFKWDVQTDMALTLVGIVICFPLANRILVSTLQESSIHVATQTPAADI